MQTDELAALPLVDRLRAMEVLWQSLDNRVERALATPTWHRDVIEQRVRALREGQEAVADLETAFDSIARSIAQRKDAARPAS